MPMKRVGLFIACALMVFISVSMASGQEFQQLNQYVEVKLIPMETTFQDGIVKMTGRLQVENTFDFAF